jgi:phosphoribosylanthranilate isomerase
MTKVKICGLTREQDIEAVNLALPDYAGFVFAASRRQIDAATAARFRALLDRRVQAVGVFVDQPIEFVGDLYRQGIIELVQLHGDENASYTKSLQEEYGCPLIKAIHVGAELPPLPEYADYLLFDSYSPDSRGGHGEAFNWQLLSGFSDSGRPFFLAGGLNASNVAGAIDALKPFCVDVSSGVEKTGLKDKDRIIEFVNIVRRETT